MMSIQSKQKRATRKRKAELVAPDCSENCQINHTYAEAAALMRCSIRHVETLVEKGKLAFIECGAGDVRKHRRIPHSAIRARVKFAPPSPLFN